MAQGVLKNDIAETANSKVFDLENVNKAKAILDANGIFEERAQNLAKIFLFDKKTYGDVNIQTIARAMEIAEIK
jgi:hypothetical protein